MALCCACIRDGDDVLRNWRPLMGRPKERPRERPEERPGEERAGARGGGLGTKLLSQWPAADGGLVCAPCDKTMGAR